MIKSHTYWVKEQNISMCGVQNPKSNVFRFENVTCLKCLKVIIQNVGEKEKYRKQYKQVQKDRKTEKYNKEFEKLLI